MTELIDLIHQSPFYELAALLTLTSVLGMLAIVLRQPMVVSYIFAGVLAGPAAFNIVQSHENIELLAELGIAILLFLVGLKLDLSLIRTLGPVALATGLGQVIFTSGIGFLIGMGLGLDVVEATYVAVALTFSSTIIIVKLLSDKREVDSLHGRIAIGFLIVQDLVVILAMMVLSTIGLGGGEEGSLAQIGQVLFYFVLILAFIGLFIKLVATPLVSRIARSPELLMIFAIAWAALLAAICTYFGLSKELGGLLAGISLASTPFREALLSRLSSLRDFLLLFFFIVLGSNLDMGMLGSQIIPALIFSFFVLIGNPLIVMIIMGFFGYRKRTGFLAGLTVAQISEFSLIFVAMGMSLGHLSAEILGLVTLVGLITIALSVYMITYSHDLYRLLEPWLGVFERRHPAKAEAEGQNSVHTRAGFDVILFGLGRYGHAIADELMLKSYSVLVVDFNPDVVKRWRGEGHDAVYGDACDPEFFKSLPLSKAKWVVSAMPQHDVGLTHEDPRRTLINGLNEEGYKGSIAVASHNRGEFKELQNYGADLIFLPFHDAAERAVTMMLEREIHQTS